MQAANNFDPMEFFKSITQSGLAGDPAFALMAARNPEMAALHLAASGHKPPPDVDSMNPPPMAFGEEGDKGSSWLPHNLLRSAGSTVADWWNSPAQAKPLVTTNPLAIPKEPPSPTPTPALDTEFANPSAGQPLVPQPRPPEAGPGNTVEPPSKLGSILDNLTPALAGLKPVPPQSGPLVRSLDPRAPHQQIPMANVAPLLAAMAGALPPATIQHLGQLLGR